MSESARFDLNPEAEEKALGLRESAALIRRAFELVWPEWPAFVVKLLFSLVSLLPVFLLAWPLKILIDTVILGIPIAQNPTPYPFFIQPWVDRLEGLSPLAVVIWVSLAGMGLIFLFGAFGTSQATRDEVGDFGNRLANGQDSATRTENEASYATSKMGGILGLMEYGWTLRLSHRINHRLRTTLFARIQKLPMQAFDDVRIGDAMFRVIYDTPAITKLCYDLVIDPIRAPLQIAIVIWILGTSYAAAPKLAGVALLVLPATFLLSLFFLSPLSRRSRFSRVRGATTTSAMEESMNNVLAVQSLGGMQTDLRRFAERSEESFQAWFSLAWAFLAVFGLAVAIVTVALAYVFWNVTLYIIDGVLTVGDFGVLLVLYGQLAQGGRQLAFIWLRQQDNLAGLARVFALMDLPEEARVEGAPRLGNVRVGVTIEDLVYRYPGGATALQGVNLRAEIGELVALVGATGAGKTTLASMIPRFHDPSEGRICIDGHDISQVDLDSLREQVSFVFQETVLLDGTVEQNIRVGFPQASEAEVRRAARVAGADEFIRRLPDGYHTELGVGGGKLSVGQKQRISIARGLVRRSPILILDEPTSALDPETERGLVDALQLASRESLVIVIAHRLSTIRCADRIYFLDEGRIVEEGSHEELMGRPDGAYREFVALQTIGAA